MLRRDYLFRGDQYAQMTRKVTKTFFHDSSSWDKKKNQNLDFLDYISNDSLFDTVFGNFIIRAIKEFLEKVSYLATCWFLVQCFLFIGKGYRKFMQRHAKKELIVVRNVEAATRQRVQLSNLHDSWENVLSKNYDFPPPYNPTF